MHDFGLRHDLLADSLLGLVFFIFWLICKPLAYVPILGKNWLVNSGLRNVDFIRRWPTLVFYFFVLWRIQGRAICHVWQSLEAGLHGRLVFCLGVEALGNMELTHLLINCIDRLIGGAFRLLLVQPYSLLAPLNVSRNRLMDVSIITRNGALGKHLVFVLWALRLIHKIA